MDSGNTLYNGTPGILYVAIYLYRAELIRVQWGRL